MVSVLNFILGNHISGNNSLSTAQMELLLCLSRQRVDIQMEQEWTPVAGPLELNIARFSGEGLIEEASVEERIDARYKMAEIKLILDGRGIKAKGKKQDMIRILLESMPADQAELLVADVRMYRLTAEGSRKVGAFTDRKELTRLEMEQDALALLARGDVRKAWSRIAKYKTEQVLCDPKWNRAVPDIIVCEAAHLTKFDYNDLPLNEGQKKEIGSIMALSVLLGESFSDAGKRLIKYAEGTFDWAQVLAFHRPSPCGASEMSSDPESLAELYATTRVHEALSLCELNGLKASKPGKGVKILPVCGNDCVVCHGGKFNYSWSEIASMPRVPKQLGCMCSYSAWL